MALKGNVKDFNLDEIIRFIALGKKTGSLEIEGPQETASLFFKNGLIYYVGRSVRPESVTERTLEKINLPENVKKGITDGSLFPPFKAKLEEEQKREIEKIIIEQTADAFADVILWSQGEFIFKANEQATREDWGLGVESEAFLEEAKKRGEVFNRYFRYAESLDVPLKLKREIDLEEDIILSGREWSLICCYQIGYSIVDIVRETGMSLTSVLLAVASLFEKGLLVVDKERRVKEKQVLEKAIKEEKEQEVAEVEARKEEEKEEVRVSTPEIVKEEEVKPQEPLEIEVKKPEEKKEIEEENLIDELAAITGKFDLKTGGGSEGAENKPEITKQELMDILKTLKKL